MAYAQHEFALDRPAADGVALRVHYAKACPAALDGPPLPPALAYLWRRFQALHRGRSRNGMAPTPASHLDLMAWQINSGIRCKPWETDVLMMMGVAWANAMAAETPAASLPRDGASLPPPPKIGEN